MGVPGTDGGLGPGHRDARGRPGPDLHLDGPLLGEPLRALHHGQEHRPEPDGIHVRHGRVADHDQLGLLPLAELLLDGPGRSQQVGRDPGQLQTPREQPGGVHELGDHGLHADRVVGQPFEHHQPLLVLELIPLRHEGPSKPLERGERRPNVVGRAGHDPSEPAASYREGPARALPGRFEEHQGRRRGEVEGFGSAGDRGADRSVGQSSRLGRQAAGFVAEQHRGRSGQIARIDRLVSVR